MARNVETLLAQAGDLEVSWLDLRVPARVKGVAKRKRSRKFSLATYLHCRSLFRDRTYLDAKNGCL